MKSGARSLTRSRESWPGMSEKREGTAEVEKEEPIGVKGDWPLRDQGACWVPHLTAELPEDKRVMRSKK